MEHYVETGDVLGKGTHELEGYSIEGKTYYGPGELPHFDHEFFEIPHGKSEDVLFEEFKEKLNKREIPDGPAGDQSLREFKQKVAGHCRQADRRCNVSNPREKNRPDRPPCRVAAAFRGGDVD